jgi:hypothetical protein
MAHILDHPRYGDYDGLVRREAAGAGGALSPTYASPSALSGRSRPRRSPGLPDYAGTVRAAVIDSLLSAPGALTQPARVELPSTLLSLCSRARPLQPVPPNIEPKEPGAATDCESLGGEFFDLVRDAIELPEIYRRNVMRRRPTRANDAASTPDRRLKSHEREQLDAVVSKCERREDKRCNERNP